MCEHNWAEVEPEASFLISVKIAGSVCLVSVGLRAAHFKGRPVPVSLTGELAAEKTSETWGFFAKEYRGQLSPYKHQRVTFNHAMFETCLLTVSKGPERQ